MTRSRIRIAFFNPILAHYRAGLLRELKSNRQCEFFWFADLHDSTAIPAIDLSADPHFTRAPYSNLGPLNWQSDTLRAAFGDYDVYIFLGSANWLSSWVGALIARLRGKRVLFWTHGWMRHDPFLKRLVRNSLYRLAHGLLLYGARAREFGLRYGFEDARLHVIYNSLDVDEQQRLRMTIGPDDSRQLRLELFGDAETPVAIATARLTPVKQFDLLIRVLGALARNGKRVNLLVVGDGPERGTLEALAVQEGIRAAFVGACYDEPKLARYFACATVTVSPGNVGLTCMHSLGYGIPVITHDNPDDQMPEWEAIVPGVTGALFKQRDAASLAGAIDEWTRHSWVPLAVQMQCLHNLRARYHPSVQGQAIVNAVLGNSAFAGAPTMRMTNVV